MAVGSRTRSPKAERIAPIPKSACGSAGARGGGCRLARHDRKEHGGRLSWSRVTILARCHAEAFPECTVEGADRTVTQLERDGEYRHAPERRILQPYGSLPQAVGMKKIVEVPKSQAAVDHAPQDVLLRIQQARKLGNRECAARVEPLGHETPRQPVEHALLDA